MQLGRPPKAVLSDSSEEAPQRKIYSSFMLEDLGHLHSCSLLDDSASLAANSPILHTRIQPLVDRDIAMFVKLARSDPA